MLDAKSLLDLLKNAGISFFSGVADSTIGEFLSLVGSDRELTHRASVNEGVAISQAAGYFLATSNVPCVYLQNSGLGNAINPLTSLIGDKLIPCPIVLLIGWRGAPGVDDEVQHELMGEMTETLLDAMNIRYVILDSDTSLESTARLLDSVNSSSGRPIAILIKPGAFARVRPLSVCDSELADTKGVIQDIIRCLQPNDVVVGSTGYISREIDAACRAFGRSTSLNFYNIGAMGHTSSLAREISVWAKNSRVICIDGDGSVLMHAGSLVNNAVVEPGSFVHIVLDNGMYESTGGQATISKNEVIANLMTAAGYSSVEIGMGRLLDFLTLEADRPANQMKGFYIRVGPNRGGIASRPCGTQAEQVRDLSDSLRNLDV